MPYHEYLYGKRYHRRNAGRQRFELAELPDRQSELGQARQELMRRLGREGFYQFHQGLPGSIVMDQAALLKATNAKLMELDQQPEQGEQLSFGWNIETCFQDSANGAERGI